VQSCAEVDKDIDVVAEVHGKQLLRKSFNYLFDGSETKIDSIEIASDFVENWMESEALVYTAKQNKTIDENEIVSRVREFENTLWIHKNENAYIESNLDTLITTTEFGEYYESHKADFQLNDYLVKVIYLKVSSDAPDLNLVDRWYKLNKEDELGNIEAYAKKYGDNFYYDIENWIYFDQLAKEIPLKDVNKDRFITRKMNVKIDENDYFYYLNVIDYKLKNTLSPLEFEKGNIKRRILNSRMKKLREAYKEEILQKAKNEKAIKLY
jgi:hypothetical protein